MQIFVINGNAKCGKTTFGKFVGGYLKSQGIPFLHGSSIDPVKEYLKEEGWKGQKWDGVTKDDFWRNAMYECKCWMMGDMERPYRFESYAVNLLCDLVRNGNNEPGVLCHNAALFFDIREPENIQRLIDYVTMWTDISIHTVYVDRNSNEIFNNYADTHQENMVYDIMVDNNGSLEDLEAKSVQFAEEYIIEHEEQKREFRNKA